MRSCQGWCLEFFLSRLGRTSVIHVFPCLVDDFCMDTRPVGRSEDCSLACVSHSAQVLTSEQ